MFCFYCFDLAFSIKLLALSYRFENYSCVSLLCIELVSRTFYWDAVDVSDEKYRTFLHTKLWFSISFVQLHSKPT